MPPPVLFVSLHIQLIGFYHCAWAGTSIATDLSIPGFHLRLTFQQLIGQFKNFAVELFSWEGSAQQQAEEGTQTVAQIGGSA